MAGIKPGNNLWVGLTFPASPHSLHVQFYAGTYRWTFVTLYFSFSKIRSRACGRIAAHINCFEGTSSAFSSASSFPARGSVMITSGFPLPWRTHRFQYVSCHLQEVLVILFNSAFILASIIAASNYPCFLCSSYKILRSSLFLYTDHKLFHHLSDQQVRELLCIIGMLEQNWFGKMIGRDPEF